MPLQHRPWSSKTANVNSAGFFLDSYDLFIVNLVSPIWSFE